MRDISGERVQQAVASCAALLRTVADRDWTAVRAGRVEWDCHATAFHIAEDLIAYAANLAGRAQDDYVPFEITLDDGTDNHGLIHVIETTGALFTATIRTTPPEVRAFHPYPFRSANREGFAAMGIAEVLLHTHDIAEGFGMAYEPPAELPEFVLTRIFPHVQPGPDHWRTLLWATGRGDLPGRAPVTEWRWRNNLVIPADRLTLQGVTPAAAADLSAGGDGGFTWIVGGPYEGTREAAGMVLKAREAGVHRPEFGLFVLVRKEDGLAVGGMGFHGTPDEDGRAEVGYDLVEGARGRGYASEALSALSEWAVARDDVQLLCATVKADNLPSQGVAARAGYVRAVHEEQDMDETLQLYIRSGAGPTRPTEHAQG
ncbi:GNAT family N-acetyltransferase [Streptomyces viridochromogenes]|uniref:GNAT family N-acetyltransferase n=1 Tax=Streptomyces viridochromogenes TaxID=1938 RepID=UPI00069D8004|nr:GNAT family N-acetyltransferase [Streptomyces viridochromogenes]KOG16079.1 acetyltransferase [Streptomyces viridochromogenes]KOG16413.1 acetyltransferase [Streptomyces viridochromogenes]